MINFYRFGYVGGNGLCVIVWWEMLSGVKI